MAAKTSASNSEAARQKLNDDFKVLMQDTQALLEATKGDLSGKAGEARTQLEKNYEAMKARYEELGGRVADTVHEKAQATEQLVAEYPWHSLGISFGVGLLVGLVMHRK